MSGANTARRPWHPMPADVREALIRYSLAGVFNDRPSYQQNDYIGWIMRAKREDTRLRRINQMIEELASGRVYMKMPYKLKQPRGSNQ